MPTIGWRDAAFATSESLICYRDYVVRICEEHIEQWKDDPDGRFKLKPVSGNSTAAELDKFFPSL